ncbi:hypothetical protein RRG08_045834 [Elysia crispata]|uniref:Uncharacterized protein n=1 Tax=Elysia crispata TaxID=231223 RepID=A0AAE1B2F3_9GAST|nr:hypothetical protein RRG08_045834 [Elysia crispata]
MGNLTYETFSVHLSGGLQEAMRSYRMATSSKTYDSNLIIDRIINPVLPARVFTEFSGLGYLCRTGNLSLPKAGPQGLEGDTQLKTGV